MRKPIRFMTDVELLGYDAELERRWTQLHVDLEESGGCAGSPSEWILEESDLVKSEIVRRKLSGGEDKP